VAINFPTTSGDITTNTSAGATTLAVNKPSNLTNGDVLFISVYSQYGNGTVTSAPSGFSVAFSWSVRGGGLYYKVITNAASEPSSYSFTFSGSGRICLIATRGIGLDTTNPIDVVGTQATQSTTPVAASVTPTPSDDVLMTMEYVNYSAATTAVWTVPSGMTMLQSLNSPTSTNTSATAIAIQQLSSTTATGTRTYTVSPTIVNGSAVNILLKSLATGPTAAFTSSSNGLSVTVDGSGSTNGNSGTITNYTWDYGDSSTASGVTPTPHVYGAPGTYTITLTVTDSNNRTGTVSHAVTVTSTAVPAVVNITTGATYNTTKVLTIPTPAAGNGLIMHLLHQVTGTITVADSAGNGWVRRVASENATPTGASGQYKVDVWDCLSLSSGSLPTSVTVTGPTTNEIVMTVYEVSGNVAYATGAQSYAGTSTTFSAPAVSAATNTFVTGGIAYHDTSNSATVSSPYIQPGGSGTTTTRMDSAYAISSSSGSTNLAWTVGASTVAGLTIATYATPAANAPSAVFTTSVNALTLLYDASNSTASGATIATYQWDFGDGTTLTSTTPVSSPHSYATAGTYNVTLTVTDTNSLTGTVSHSVTVVTPSAQAPTRIGYTITDPGDASGTFITLDPSVITGGSAISTGNWMVAALAFTTTSTITPPSGWTVIQPLTVIGSMQYAVYAGFRQSGDTTYTFNLNGGANTGGAILMWGDNASTNLSNWIVGSVANRTISTQNSAPAVTTTMAHSLLLGFSFERTSATETGIVSVTGAAEWAYVAQTGYQYETIDIAYLSDVTSGLTNTIYWNYSNAQSTNGAAFQMAIPGATSQIGVGYPAVYRDTSGTNHQGKMFYWDGTAAHDFSTTLERTFSPTTVSQFLAHTPWFAAHRGFSYSYPEETLYGYQGATDWGIRAIEISVQKSASGTFWCFHDATTDRTTGYSGTISSMTDSQIAALNNLGSTATANPTQPARPTAKLLDVLNIYTSTHVIFIEDKTYANTTNVLNIMDSYGTSGRPSSEIFIWKVDATSSSSFYTPAASRGYHRWGYIFDSSMASSFNSAVSSGKMDMIGMDYNSSDATLTSAIATANSYGVAPSGHIINSTTQRDRLLGFGMTGLMVSNKDVVPPWYNTNH